VIWPLFMTTVTPAGDPDDQGDAEQVRAPVDERAR
jgi:hypothetical protein